MSLLPPAQWLLRSYFSVVNIHRYRRNVAFCSFKPVLSKTHNLKLLVLSQCRPFRGLLMMQPSYLDPPYSVVPFSRNRDNFSCFGFIDLDSYVIFSYCPKSRTAFTLTYSWSNARQPGAGLEFPCNSARHKLMILACIIQTYLESIISTFQECQVFRAVQSRWMQEEANWGKGV